MNYSELTSSNTNDTSKDIKSYYYRIVFLEKVRKFGHLAMAPQSPKHHLPHLAEDGVSQESSAWSGGWILTPQRI
jgi:hypothetical protein